MNKLNLKIITLNGIIFEGDVVSVVILAKDGQITICANHTPLISALGSGLLSVKKEDGQKENFNISEGVLETRYGSEAVILTDKAEKI